MTGYHTRWARPAETAGDPERIAMREALAFGKALHDIRTELAAALNATVHLTPGHDLGSASFRTLAA